MRHKRHQMWVVWLRPYRLIIIIVMLLINMLHWRVEVTGKIHCWFSQKHWQHPFKLKVAKFQSIMIIHYDHHDHRHDRHYSYDEDNDHPYQDLVEQHQMGSNPDYGIPTPTLVSPPKVKIWPEIFTRVNRMECLARCFRAPNMLGPTSTLASLLPTSRLPFSNNIHLTGE